MRKVWKLFNMSIIFASSLYLSSCNELDNVPLNYQVQVTEKNSKNVNEKENASDNIFKEFDEKMDQYNFENYTLTITPKGLRKQKITYQNEPLFIGTDNGFIKQVDNDKIEVYEYVNCNNEIYYRKKVIDGNKQVTDYINNYESTNGLDDVSFIYDYDYNNKITKSDNNYVINLTLDDLYKSNNNSFNELYSFKDYIENFDYKITFIFVNEHDLKIKTDLEYKIKGNENIKTFVNYYITDSIDLSKYNIDGLKETAPTSIKDIHSLSTINTKLESTGSNSYFKFELDEGDYILKDLLETYEYNRYVNHVATFYDSNGEKIKSSDLDSTLHINKKDTYYLCIDKSGLFELDKINVTRDNKSSYNLTLDSGDYIVIDVKKGQTIINNNDTKVLGLDFSINEKEKYIIKNDRQIIIINTTSSKQYIDIEIVNA